MNQKEDALSRLLRADISRPVEAREVLAPLFERPWNDFTNQFMATDIQTWLVDESLMRADKLTMAHGLELRVPLLDPQLMDVAFRIPSRFKLSGPKIGKRVFREAFRDLIPPFIQRQKKRGFFSPAAKWLRGDLLPLAREIFSESYYTGAESYFDLAMARRLLDDHVSGKGYHLNQLWPLLLFRVWRRRFAVKG
jgi:asparagine synthase (glutamine-hydrolysing)